MRGWSKDEEEEEEEERVVGKVVEGEGKVVDGEGKVEPPPLMIRTCLDVWNNCEPETCRK